MPSPNTDKLAVLIDADNAQPGVAGELLAQVARYGTATIKRAYGDWTTPNLGGWKESLHSLAIQPIQQFRYTTGKNAADSALIIDAMDLLHGGSVDGFAWSGRTAISPGWASLSAVGSLVVKSNPSFDPRNYGCQKLGELVRRQPYLDVRSVSGPDGSPSVHSYVRLKGS